MSWNQTVESFKKYIGTKYGSGQCTAFVQGIMYTVYNNSFYCADGYPRSWVKNASTRAQIEKYFKIITKWEDIQPYDVVVWDPYNVSSHSCIALKRPVNNTVECLTQNYRGSQHGGSTAYLPEKVSIQAHHKWGFLAALRPLENVNNKPIVCLDSVVCESRGTIKVSGWAFDPDTTTESIHVHVYNADDVLIGSVKADADRPDVNAAYSITGRHGFSGTLETTLEGSQTIRVAALDSTNPAELHTFSNSRTVFIKPALKVGMRISVKKACASADGTTYISYGSTPLSCTIIADATKSARKIQHPYAVRFDDDMVRHIDKNCEA